MQHPPPNIARDRALVKDIVQRELAVLNVNINARGTRADIFLSFRGSMSGRLRPRTVRFPTK